jgi:site-specific DNA recombinase
VLNGQGRYTKRGNLWTQRNISRLLRNPVYVGDVVYGRREKHLVLPDDSDPLARKKRAAWVNDPEHLVVCKDGHSGIVTREVFEQAQAVMDKRRPLSGPTEHSYLLTKGLLVCTCGSSMTITYNKRHRTIVAFVKGTRENRDAIADIFVLWIWSAKSSLESVQMC